MLKETRRRIVINITLMRIIIIISIVFIMIVCGSPSNMRKTSDILTKLKALRRNFIAKSVRERIVIVVAHFSPCF